MQFEFWKMHGLGNDFIVIDERDEIKVEDALKPEFAKKYCERRFSVGADGVLFLENSEDKDANMRIFNSDGSKAETCVNGLRCVAFVLYETSVQGDWEEFDISTAAGSVHAGVKRIKPNLADVEIDVLGRREYIGKGRLKAVDRRFEFHEVNVGNPHAVIFLDEPVDGFPVRKYGPAIEHHERFRPDRTNTEFVNVLSDKELKMRVYERGAGETKACGSGSLAVVIAASEVGYAKRNEWVTVRQTGGKLEILYGDELRLKGPAEISYRGSISYPN